MEEVVRGLLVAGKLPKTQLSDLLRTSCPWTSRLSCGRDLRLVELAR